MDGPWKVYFRLNGHSLEDALGFINEEIRTKSLWYFHPNGVKAGPHVHAVVWDHEQTAETLRNKIKKRFNLDNKTHFGVSNKYDKNKKNGQVMTDETVPGHVVYLTKGKYDPFYSTAYDKVFYDKCKSEWKEPTTVHISGDLTVITKGDVKKVKSDYALAKEAVTLYMEQCNIKAEIHALEGYFDKHKLVNIVRALCDANCISANYRRVANIVQDAVGTIAPGYYMNKILSMV